MHCPVDGTELKVSDREGIEIDYCPKCRGVWLDHGELEKMIDQDSRGRRRNNRDEGDDEEGGFLGNLFGGFGGRNDD